jgi:hypothetical protein
VAWANSKIFRQWIADSLAPTASFVGKWNSTDVYNAALYNNTTTPDATVTAALSGYNAGTSQWVVANEVIDTLNSNWVAGGRAVTGTGSGGGYSSSALLITFTGSNTSGAGNLTITNAYGDLLYDSTLSTPVSKQGAAFHYFGGAQSVTNGTFTIQWNASGIMQVTF